MDTIYQLDNELMVDLSDDAQELVQGGIGFLHQFYAAKALKVVAANGPTGSYFAVDLAAILSKQSVGGGGS